MIKSPFSMLDLNRKNDILRPDKAAFLAKSIMGTTLIYTSVRHQPESMLEDNGTTFLKPLYPTIEPTIKVSAFTFDFRVQQCLSYRPPGSLMPI
jgi:hypothetical protein